MSVQNKIKAIPLSSFNTNNLLSNYQVINGASGLPHACVLIRFTNDSSQAVTLSYDGVNDHDYIPGNAIVSVVAQENSSPNNYICLFPKGTHIYVKGTAGAGLFTMSGYYQPVGG